MWHELTKYTKLYSMLQSQGNGSLKKASEASLSSVKDAILLGVVVVVVVVFVLSSLWCRRCRRIQIKAFPSLRIKSYTTLSLPSCKSVSSFGVLEVVAFIKARLAHREGRRKGASSVVSCQWRVFFVVNFVVYYSKR